MVTDRRGGIELGDKSKLGDGWRWCICSVDRKSTVQIGDIFNHTWSLHRVGCLTRGEAIDHLREIGLEHDDDRPGQPWLSDLEIWSSKWLVCELVVNLASGRGFIVCDSIYSGSTVLRWRDEANWRTAV